VYWLAASSPFYAFRHAGASDGIECSVEEDGAWLQVGAPGLLIGVGNQNALARPPAWQRVMLPRVAESAATAWYRVNVAAADVPFADPGVGQMPPCSFLERQANRVLACGILVDCSTDADWPTRNSVRQQATHALQAGVVRAFARTARPPMAARRLLLHTPRRTHYTRRTHRRPYLLRVARASERANAHPDDVPVR